MTFLTPTTPLFPVYDYLRQAMPWSCHLYFRMPKLLNPNIPDGQWKIDRFGNIHHGKAVTNLAALADDIANYILRITCRHPARVKALLPDPSSSNYQQLLQIAVLSSQLITNTLLGKNYAKVLKDAVGNQRIANDVLAKLRLTKMWTLESVFDILCSVIDKCQPHFSTPQAQQPHFSTPQAQPSAGGCQPQSKNPQLKSDTEQFQDLVPEHNADADLEKYAEEHGGRTDALDSFGLQPGVGAYASSTLDIDFEFSTNRYNARSHIAHILSSTYVRAEGDTEKVYNQRNRRQVPGMMFAQHQGLIPSVSVILDISGSMSPRKLRKALSYISEAIFHANSEVGVYLYTANASLQSKGICRKPYELASYPIQLGGGTNMGGAIHRAAHDRNRPNVILCVTDGETEYRPIVYRCRVGIILATGEPLQVIKQYKIPDNYFTVFLENYE